MEVLGTAPRPLRQEDRRRYSYWCFRIFIASWIGYAGFYFCRRNISWTPLPSTSHPGWLNGLADLLMVFGAGYMVGQFVGGWAADRFGARRTVLFGGMLSLVSTGQGFGWPAMMKLFSVWLPRRELAIGMAWWSTSYALGSFLATALATALSTVEFIPIVAGSKLSILVPCVILFLTTVFFYIRARDLPSEVGLEQIHSQTDPLSPSIGWMPVLRNREIQLLAIMYFFLKLTRYALLFWLPVYIIETQHSKGNSALLLSSLFELTGFIGALFASYASERWFDSRRYPVGAGMLFLAAFVFLLHPLVSSWGTVPTGISIALIGMLIFGPDVLMASVAVVEAVPSDQTGRAAGYVNGMGSLGQMVSPVLVALSTRFFGWNSIFSIFVVCSLLAASLLVVRWNSPVSQDLMPKTA